VNDLAMLAELVEALRAAGVATYEGAVPNAGGMGVVKLTVRPPVPTPPPQPDRQPHVEKEPERPRLPAGLGGLA
jgi:hypothetical protein